MEVLIPWLPVLGWIAIPFLNHAWNSRRDSRIEYNDNIDKLEDIFNDMNEVAADYFTKPHFCIGSYYKLTAYNYRIQILIKRLGDINSSIGNQNSNITLIRKISTDDRNRDSAKLGELTRAQSRILAELPKNYTYWPWFIRMLRWR
ncbi:hypothetical protein [Shewanella algae]|uniref:hypothetical protein n=1 Tax=Shewanella algae TaxID=38313 RepID=UPI0031F5915A